MIDQITGRQHGNENFLGPRICRKYLGVQTWRVKNEKIEKEKKGRQGKIKALFILVLRQQLV